MRILTARWVLIWTVVALMIVTALFSFACGAAAPQPNTVVIATPESYSSNPSQDIVIYEDKSRGNVCYIHIKLQAMSCVHSTSW